jgi:hypothetical protein
MNAMGKKWMAKDLFEQCEICDGTGSPPGDKRMCLDLGRGVKLDRRSDGSIVCPSCGGEKFIRIGLTVGQVERMRATIDRATSLAKHRLEKMIVDLGYAINVNAGRCYDIERPLCDATTLCVELLEIVDPKPIKRTAAVQCDGENGG